MSSENIHNKITTEATTAAKAVGLATNVEKVYKNYLRAYNRELKLLTFGQPAKNLEIRAQVLADMDATTDATERLRVLTGETMLASLPNVVEPIDATPKALVG